MLHNAAVSFILKKKKIGTGSGPLYCVPLRWHKQKRQEGKDNDKKVRAVLQI